MGKKTAVILFNLGGPDKLESVRSFLFNLFSDKAIISLPQPFRWLIAKFISISRTSKAQENYALMGGASPLLYWSERQALALENSLNQNCEDIFKVFVCMRYWHPFTEEVASIVKSEGFDDIILLPLYPQFSTTTTGSSFKEWNKVCKRINLSLPTKSICCYPTERNFILSHAKNIDAVYQESIKNGRTRILFSAHGLPEKIIKRGDPYQYHVNLTVSAIIEQMSCNDVDYQICYQSKVGPLKWLEPSTESAIINASEAKLRIIIVPIAFVSEHIETLVELDIEYKELAERYAAPSYIRIPSLGLDDSFITALHALCKSSEPPLICQEHECCLRKRRSDV